MNRENRIITISATAHFLTHMFVLIFPAVIIPYSRETGATLSEVFALGFSMYFLYGALAIPAGYFADHWSRLGMLRICMFGMGLFSLIAGITESDTIFTLSLAGIGLFCGIYHPAGLGLLAHEIGKQGRAHGINGIFGNMGIAAAPLFAGGVMLFFDWRWVYILAGLLGFLGVLLTYILTFDETSHQEMDAKKGADTHQADYWVYFAILCVAMTFAGLTYRANMTILPAYFETAATGIVGWLASIVPSSGTDGSISGAAGLLVSTVFMFSMIGQYAGGKVADRYDLRKAYFVYQLSSLPFILAMWSFTELPLYAAAAFHFFFALGMQPIENSLVSKFLPRRWVSTGYGIKFTLTFGVGSLAMYQIAYIEKWWDLNHIYPMLAIQIGIISLLAATLFIVSRKKMPRVAN